MRKEPKLVDTNADLFTLANELERKSLCPIFHVSSVTGTGLESLKTLISHLIPKTNNLAKKVDEPSEFLIETNFFFKDIGLIVSGILKCGIVALGQTLLLGPDKLGNFTNV
jgi:GTPase